MREAHVSIDETAYEKMGVAELVSVCCAAEVRTIAELTCYGNGGIIQVEVGSRVDETRLDALDYVDQWERISESEDACVYLIGFTAPGLSEEMADHAADLIGTCDPNMTEVGATMSFVGPQDAIRGMIEEFGSSGVFPSLQSLGDYDATGGGALAELTDRQRDVLETAYKQGYYEVPREASTAEIATELDIDPSTVTEHLQRAERNLLTQHLSTTW